MTDSPFMTEEEIRREREWCSSPQNVHGFREASLRYLDTISAMAKRIGELERERDNMTAHIVRRANP